MVRVLIYGCASTPNHIIGCQFQLYVEETGICYKDFGGGPNFLEAMGETQILRGAFGERNLNSKVLHTLRNVQLFCTVRD